MVFAKRLGSVLVLTGFVLLLVALDCAAVELEKIDDVVKEMKEELGEGFIVEKLEPFVVATDDSAGAMRSHKATISRCMEALYKEFFTEKLKTVIRVYLLKDDESYRGYVKKSENREVDTPYGFCTAGGTKLVMNIGTGTGTLVHEMVHAFIKPDFPDVPVWFNEGLASLFEQCSTADDTIRGLVNWRLPGLQQAIKDGNFVRFEDLMAMSDRQFYSRESRAHYAEARYLCMFMQEKKLLKTFYKQFREAARSPAEAAEGEPKPEPDRSGFRTFKALFDQPVEKVEEEFQKWVMELKWTR
ncbi:MAG: hypothetical protein RDV41_06775 [Planctomycetota bacterium]|nr:hypothetical protein [Planctomycetota bacterium]